MYLGHRRRSADDADLDSAYKATKKTIVKP
jgi:hypothetical protein